MIMINSQKCDERHCSYRMCVTIYIQRNKCAWR